MYCTSCGRENRETARFCGECGNALDLNCPNCGSPSPPANRFCDACGQLLSSPVGPPPARLSADEKLVKIQRYLPRGVVERVLAQREKIEGERKQVTVMFCDLEGFTPLTESLDPEEAYALMDRVYEILIQVVHDYEGTVNEMTGDGIMALFGAPLAIEDAPQRAIRSALAIHREMVQFNEKVKREHLDLPLLRMRVGIHTGPVVVGTLGNDLRVEFKAVGDTVNLASRMEGLAEPGTTYVTEATFKATEGLFRFEKLGEKRIKGKGQPVSVYRVLAPSTRRTRFDVSAERGLTPFVGRERELELLLDACERAKEGRGQAVSIVADAGVGKSRLLYEFRKAVANEDVTFLEGKCLSYSRGVPYHPVVDILKGHFEIYENTGTTAVEHTVRKGLRDLQVDENQTLPYLLELLSVPDSGIDPNLRPDTRKDRTIQALNRILLKAAEVRLLVVAVEDLHWIDRTSEDVFKDMLEHIAGARVLLLFTYRTGFPHAWANRSYHSQITLSRLSNRESLAVVSHLLHTEHIPENLATLILEKTEGVPFFIEEFLRSLKDLKVIERRGRGYVLAKSYREMAIPSTIHDVIMARVDVLPDGARNVLQTGSIIEREFSHELTQRVTDLPESELLGHLSILKDAELIYERGVYPRSTYIFKHALTREVIYDSILDKKRKKLHERIGRGIEELYGHNTEEKCEVLCEHFIASENFEKAAGYSLIARKKAEKSASLNSAIDYGKKNVNCLETLPWTEEVKKKMIKTRAALGLYYIQTGHHADARDVIAPIIDIASPDEHERCVAQIHCILGTYSMCADENLSKAMGYFESALQIGDKLNDVLSLAMTSIFSGVCLSFDCRFAESIKHFERALRINVKSNVLWTVAAVQAVKAFLVHTQKGDIRLAYTTTEEALDIAAKSGDVFSKSYAYITHGISCYYMGFFPEAINFLTKGIDYYSRINLFTLSPFAHYFLGESYSAVGNHEDAEPQYETSIGISERLNLFPSCGRLSKIALHRNRSIANGSGKDSHGIGRWGDRGIKLYEGPLMVAMGEYLMHLDGGCSTRAREWIANGLRANERNGMKWALGRAHALSAELSKREGDAAEARTDLAKAAAIFRECGADGWARQSEDALTAR